ncbi:MAG: CRISPR-associated helicase Cas3' [Thermoguttaceae bacterium]|nr:CRISPR-associated helicase Cas3' [Thermoguttaceae bacterium]
MYIARFDNNDNNKVQSLEEHLSNCENYVNKNCDIDDFKSICVLTALLHDLGKYSTEFQTYIEQQRSNPEKNSSKVTHSVQGAMLLTELLKERIEDNTPQQFLIEMIRIAVISHHGLRDAIDKQMVSSYKAMKDRYISANPNGFSEVRSASADYIPKILSLFENGSKDIESISNEIEAITNSEAYPQQFGQPSFYKGLLARYNLSLLIDADRTDAASFENENIKLLSGPEPWDVILKQWESLRDNLESTLEKNDVVSPVDSFRREISEMCSAAANKEIGIFRLSAPTGSGKTRSALRFAVNHAIANKLKRIVYVAPFNSILEQNADVIRNFLDNNNLLLEHHCNYTSKEKESSDGEELDRYSYLTQSWDARIIATSAVQFLEALFSSDSSAIRHFHSLANSVIIFDEIQSLPIRCTELFNLAVNFLTSICKSSVILCSATQPPIDNLKQNCLKCVNENDIIPDSDFNRYYKAFKRTKLHDKTKQKGYSIKELADLILATVEEISDCNSVLIIVNTKSNAKTLFQELKKHNDNLPKELQFERLFHLSTNMCPKHRKDVLNEIKRFQSANKRFICVSTQLIEAGVDISFPVVFRALAGLDSIIQAAGRCNRNAEREEGRVFIFDISQTEEKVNSIEDIKNGQKVMRGLLNQYKNNPQLFDDDLSSPKALIYYYRKYYIERQNDTDFNVFDTTLVDLLSDNLKIAKRLKSVYMYQAFKTAGDKFEVISETGKISLIVPYNEDASELLQKLRMIDCRSKNILRQLQQYTISVSESDLKQLPAKAIDTKDIDGMIILDKLYYDTDLGLSNNPGDIII